MPRKKQADVNTSTKRVQTGRVKKSTAKQAEKKPGKSKPTKGTEEDQKDFLNAVTGVFDITSKGVKEEWPDMADNLTIRFHIDKQGKKVWGQFDVGIMEGYILLDVAPDKIAPGTPVKFKWRGRDPENGEASSGSGQVTISGDKTVKGVFHEMHAEVDFKGKRKAMPANRSGYEASYYRLGWEEYREGGDSDFYGGI
ncbi:hypothetical protein F5884DRAFT_788887 [Xylogone sp. PMI_703]|nr:hypothetical protein F5884DRAFT_788887 [Xylogone sp. PMI_703]